MSTKKLLGSFVAVVAAVSLVAGPVFVFAADDIDQDNKDTGKDSTNTNTSSIKRKPKDTRKNTGTASASVTAKAKTGKNKQKNNTTGGSLTSGMVDFTGALTNDLNLNAAPAELPTPTTVTGKQTNDTTGQDSTNKNSLEVRDETDVATTNTATGTTTLSLTGETGQNEQTGNTTAGAVVSGDAFFSLTITNTMN